MSARLPQTMLSLLWLWKSQRQKSQSPDRSTDYITDQGVTLLECLVAVVLIGLTVAMVTPPLVIATATRVQNRRAEQAIQLAQDEIDRINTMVQRGVHERRFLPAVVPGPLDEVDPPNVLLGGGSTGISSRRANAACPAGGTRITTRYDYGTPLTARQALPIDVDGDCRADFFMQVFRTAGVTTIAEEAKPDPRNQRPARFEIGVRVYAALAEARLRAGSLDKTPAALSITGTRGQQDRRPIVTLYQPVVWGEQADVLCESLSAANRAKVPTCPQR